MKVDSQKILKQKRVVLLDMDGTITPARESIDNEMIMCLLGASHRVEIVIVSGSDFNYIFEQCGKQFISSGFASSITLMPCNGTKVYKYSHKEKTYVKVTEEIMSEKIGRNLFRELMSEIISAQATVVKQFDIPITGNFISDRNSTINWSLIGRDSSLEQRKAFVSRPNKNLIRYEAISILKDKLSKNLLDNIEFALGGQTSVDIYPKGWDKTFSLKYFTPNREAWFIGDRCEKGENDFHVFSKLDEYNRAFKTVNPEQTIEILDGLIGRFEEEDRNLLDLTELEASFFKK